MSAEWLIAGLGNPGRPYAHNRHNVGYWCINRLTRLYDIPLKVRSLAALGQGRIGRVEVLLLKPRTFVNRSGHAIAPALRAARLEPQRLIVVYDELDLPSGRIRIKPKGGHGGHNGLRSIAAAIGSTDFPRIRIGIGRPHVSGEPSWDPEVVAQWVLSDPPPDEARRLHDTVARAADAVKLLVTEGLEAAMNRYNK